MVPTNAQEKKRSDERRQYSQAKEKLDHGESLCAGHYYFALFVFE